MGFFPTYTLGELYSALFYAQAQRDIPDVEQRIAPGDLRFLTDWTGEKIHYPGEGRLAPQLCQDLTGQTLSAGAYIEYLEGKFGGFMGCSREREFLQGLR